MKAIVSKVDLLGMIGKLSGIVAASNKPVIPILANVLLEATDDQLIISATDLNISMRSYCEAKVIEKGAITLPGRRLFQLLRELTAPQVEIHASSPDVAFINAGTSHFKIQGMHQNEFPTLPNLAGGVQFSLSPVLFKELLSRTSFAAGRDDPRPILNGIFLDCQQDRLTSIGTNGKCVAKVDIVLDTPFQTPTTLVIPIKAAEEMIKVIDDKEEKVTVTLLSDKIAIETGKITLIAKLLTGQYPDVMRIIPQKSDKAVLLHREELTALLRQLALFLSDEASSVRFTFAPGTLHLAAMSGDIGEGKVHMPVDYSGEKLDIAFNPYYFLDILRHSKDETILCDISDSYNPALITDSSNAHFVLMPMRLIDQT